MRAKLDSFSRHYGEQVLPKVECFYSLAQYILNLTKVLFVLRWDSPLDTAVTLALSGNGNNDNNNNNSTNTVDSEKMEMYRGAYKIHDLKAQIFNCLKELDPRTNKGVSISATNISRTPESGGGYLYQALECISMLLPSIIFLSSSICSTDSEKGLLRSFSQELYARVPTPVLGNILRFS